MKRIAAKYLLCVGALLLGEYLLDDISIEHYSMVLVFGLILTLLNMTLKPLALLLTIPANILTFGLFTLIVNTWMVQLSAVMIRSIEIDGFWPAFLVAAIIIVGRLLMTSYKSEHPSKTSLT